MRQSASAPRARRGQACRFVSPLAGGYSRGKSLYRHNLLLVVNSGGLDTIHTHSIAETGHFAPDWPGGAATEAVPGTRTPGLKPSDP